MDNKSEVTQTELNALKFFLGLKSNYSQARQEWENKWDMALAAFNIDKGQLLAEASYTGNSSFISPMMRWKIRGSVARIMRILFNVHPFGRIEDSKIRKAKPRTIIDLFNRYIFNYQLDHIGFKSSYRRFCYQKEIFGTAVAKIPHNVETKTMFKGAADIEVEVMNDTVFEPILITDFYTDPSKFSLQDSAANIHESIVLYEDLKAQEREEVTIEEIVTMEDGTEVAIERKETQGVYHNLDLINPNGPVSTPAHEEYLRRFYITMFGGYDEKQYEQFATNVKDENLKTKRTGHVSVSECYGKYWFVEDGKAVYDECICTIANGHAVIRLERNPFQHMHYVRPFIAGRIDPMEGCFYSHSNVTASFDLFMEHNASRQMATDSKIRAIKHMWYLDTTKQTNWNGVWRSDGIISGAGPNGLTPLLNPFLGNITIKDAQESQRDIDQIFSLSPVQEGTSDRRLVPETARGTAAVIAQNDMPLNDKIDEATEQELKVFLEMLFERNLQFKSLSDLLKVWDEKDLTALLNDIEDAVVDVNDEAAVDEFLDTYDLTELFFNPNIKILGNLELSNEVSHQAGWTQFSQLVQTLPSLAKRVDQLELGEKLLRAYGIKDDADSVFIDEDAVIQADKALAQNQQQQMEAQRAEEQRLRDEALATEDATQAIKANYNIKEMVAEAQIEAATGEKVH